MAMPLLHHGMLLVGVPYSVDELSTTTSWRHALRRQPRHLEQETRRTVGRGKSLAQALGQRVAEIALRLQDLTTRLSPYVFRRTGWSVGAVPPALRIEFVQQRIQAGHVATASRRHESRRIVGQFQAAVSCPQLERILLSSFIQRIARERPATRKSGSARSGSVNPESRGGRTGRHQQYGCVRAALSNSWNSARLPVRVAGDAVHVVEADKRRLCHAFKDACAGCLRKSASGRNTEPSPMRSQTACSR